ncbi:hypothetical protein OROHE_012693 [Orobanche hederae]
MSIPIFLLLIHLHGSLAGLLTEPVGYNTVPAVPVQTVAQTCRLDLSAELFGGVGAACGRVLDRSRCCPVLAAWLFAAHARSALQVTEASPPASSELPMMPDDSQNCVNTLQSSLVRRNIHMLQPNSSCDTVLCFCGIRLHQISSLRCPGAFNVTGIHRNATPTAAVINLEHNCKNSSYAGCTKCLGALQKVKLLYFDKKMSFFYENNSNSGVDDAQFFHEPEEAQISTWTSPFFTGQVFGLKVEGRNRRKGEGEGDVSDSDRASKMLSRDCQLMGLTWLLARNKTAYIPTVSAVLRAIMYSAHPAHESTCSPDQENMPLAVDSLQFERYDSSSASTFIPILPLIILGYLFV